MRSERFWTLVLACTCFCAGVAAGVLLSFRRHPVQAEGVFGAYQAQMIEAFDLDEERVKYLRYILQDYQNDIEDLKEQNVASLDPDLVRIGRHHRELIRTWVVPAHHRQEFDLWTAGSPLILSESKLQ
jgi:hypothetical protein